MLKWSATVQEREVEKMKKIKVLHKINIIIREENAKLQKEMIDIQIKFERN